jgi:hypothetical protein
MSVAIRRSIYGKLAGDTTLNNLLGTPAPGYAHSIYYQIAPPSASFPYVIFNKSSSVPTYTLATNALDTDVWTVKGVDRNSDTDPVDNIASRLDALLTDGTISISGKTQLYLRRDGDYNYAEPHEGQVYNHAGGEYRLLTT